MWAAARLCLFHLKCFLRVRLPLELFAFRISAISLQTNQTAHAHASPTIALCATSLHSILILPSRNVPDTNVGDIPLGTLCFGTFCSGAPIGRVAHLPSVGVGPAARGEADDDLIR